MDKKKQKFSIQLIIYDMNGNSLTINLFDNLDITFSKHIKKNLNRKNIKCSFYINCVSNFIVKNHLISPSYIINIDHYEFHVIR